MQYPSNCTQSKSLVPYALNPISTTYLRYHHTRPPSNTPNSNQDPQNASFPPIHSTHNPNGKATASCHGQNPCFKKYIYTKTKTEPLFNHADLSIKIYSQLIILHVSLKSRLKFFLIRVKCKTHPLSFIRIHFSTLTLFSFILAF